MLLAGFPKTPSEIEREALQDFGLLPRDERRFDDIDWQAIDKVLLANTALKPQELLGLTVSETVFLLRAIAEKNKGESSREDPTDFQSKLNKSIADAALYHQLTLEQKMEIARREIDY